MTVNSGVRYGPKADPGYDVAYRPEADIAAHMLWFKKPPPFEHPELGRFVYSNGAWFPSPSAGAGVVLHGGKGGPAPEVVDAAQRLLKSSAELIARAQLFVHADKHALKFMEGNGSLVWDGFSVYETSSFAVEFTMTDWPDAMISVRFENGLPTEVQLAD